MEEEDEEKEEEEKEEVRRTQGYPGETLAYCHRAVRVRLAARGPPAAFMNGALHDRLDRLCVVRLDMNTLTRNYKL